MTELRRSKVKCSKLNLKENVSAFLENRLVLRSASVSIDCDEELVEKLVSNYIIVKKILSNLPWQEQLLCKSVCRTWRDAVITLQRELLAPQDFVFIEYNSKSPNYKTSNTLTTEPLAIINFCNGLAFYLLTECKKFTSISTCSCSEAHSVLDLIDQSINSPKQCMLTVRTDYLSYMPLSQSDTAKYTVKKNMLLSLPPFSGGLFIPKIPDVSYHLVNIKLQNNITEEFFEPVNKIMETQLIKGMVIFVTDKYLLQSVEDVTFFNHIKDLQDMPYAVGGCIIDDTLSSTNDVTSLVEALNDEKEFISENVISVALFTVPKQGSESTSKTNFEMYSVIIESSEWSKPKIKKAIEEFSDNVPRFEHSIVLKLSCIGRDQWHDIEQDLFRQSFPDTPLIGCYGNGELGVNHPIRNVPEPPRNTVKRLKIENAQCNLLYSYSTVFVYYGWGKIITQ